MLASVIATIADEPRERLQRMIDRLAAQSIGPLEVVIAAPTRDRATVDSLHAHGSVAAIVTIDNPSGRRCPGLNLAACAATTDVVHRVDARSLLDRTHVARCQTRLASDASVGIVGGRQHSVEGNRGAMARGVARALANPWTTGGAPYRRVGASGAVDTVYLGSFRRAELLALGGYDETLDANEDFDLAQRYRDSGKVVWLEDGLVVDYEARAGLGDVWRQYFAFGVSKVRYWRARGERPNARQLAGLAGPVVALVGVLFAARRGHGVAVVSAGLAAAAALDQIAVGGRASAAERAVAVAGSVAVPTAWAAGAYREFVRR
ncbi:MAG: succinoglycan biosynthesis protein ExoA [Actinomycetota bacterium]|jgi:hypothetical protein